MALWALWISNFNGRLILMPRRRGIVCHLTWLTNPTKSKICSLHHNIYINICFASKFLDLSNVVLNTRIGNHCFFHNLSSNFEIGFSVILSDHSALNLKSKVSRQKRAFTIIMRILQSKDFSSSITSSAGFSFTRSLTLMQPPPYL